MVKFMERTSAAIGLIATALLVVSVSYDFAYLTGLSLSFAQVPTTLADHTRSAVLWIPIVGSAHLLGIVAGRSLPGAGSISPSRKPPIAHRVVLPLLLMVVVMIVLFPFSSGLRSGADDEVSFLAVASVLGIVAYRIVGRMARNQTPGYWLSAGTVAVAYCCGLAAYFGSAEGKAIPSLREPEWTTQLKGEGLPGKHRPLGLRQFEKVTVLVERSDLIYVVPTGDILWIMRDVKNRSFACRISPILCSGNA